MVDFQNFCTINVERKCAGNAWFNLICYHPPRQPLGQVQAFGPEDEELFEAVLSWGYGNLCDNEFEPNENENYTKD